MGKTLSALLQLQRVERQLVEVKSRLRMRENAVAVQQRKIDQLRGDWEELNAKRLERRKDADRCELDLRHREQKVTELRGVLNTAKTNKEYAAVLTQINTIKADNTKIEDQALRAMADLDAIQAEADKTQQKMDAEQARLAQIKSSSAAEIDRLSGMMADLSAKRAEAAAEVPPAELALFERIAEKLGGDAMAAIEIEGDRPPHDYVCGGCFMSLNAEHANALRTRDEVRTCDSCGRILYLETAAETQKQS
jgi:predicted  nucleic acid-binding Zn-ribbon protein